MFVTDMFVTDYRHPADADYHMPAEWAEHAGCLMAYPCRDSAHRGFVAEARTAYTNVAHAIAEFETVFMVVRPQDEKTARQQLGSQIEIIPLPIDDAWMRDSAPTFVLNKKSHEVAGIDWLFNAWGNKYTPWEADDAIAAALLRHFQQRRFLAPCVMEGGSLHTNGAGVIMTTEQCLLHKNRNPRLHKSEIEHLLCTYLGGEQVLWLAGDLRDDETDGHVDNIACFSSAEQILLMTDDNDPMLVENHQRLQQATDTNGKPYEIIRLPRPQVIEQGNDLLASYINFYFTNGGIVMPSFDVAEDEPARALLAELFPQRKIVTVAATDIVRGGGGIHCITQQIPRGK